jgi:hypothetical protein
MAWSLRWLAKQSDDVVARSEATWRSHGDGLVISLLAVTLLVIANVSEAMSSGSEDCFVAPLLAMGIIAKKCWSL